MSFFSWLDPPAIRSPKIPQEPKVVINYGIGSQNDAVTASCREAMRGLSQIDARALIIFYPEMSANLDNVISFPLHRRRQIVGCPTCGKRDDIWQIGKLLWAYCETHELRWVVADYAGVTRATINRREMCQGLEFLATYVEVSR